MLNTYEKIVVDEGIRNLQGRDSADEQQRAAKIVDLAEFLLDRLVAAGEMPQWRAWAAEPLNTECSHMKEEMECDNCGCYIGEVLVEV